MHLIYILLLFIFTSCSITKSTQNVSGLSFSYADGSNNSYTLKGKTLSYDPIKPIESSSGTYDGGEPKQVNLSEEELAKLTQLVSASVNCQSCHQDNRAMMTGMLRTDGKSFILKSRSSEKDNLEKGMKFLLE